MNRTKINWPWPNLFTVNPFIGCSKVSEGCRYCYAERMAVRLANAELSSGKLFGQRPYCLVAKAATLDGKIIDGWNDTTLWRPKVLDTVRKRHKPASIFWCSMSDLFHEANRDEQIDKVFAMICATPQHQHIILTKRPKRMAKYLDWSTDNRGHAIEQAAIEMNLLVHFPEESMDNVWLGVSVENQKRADERVPVLLGIRGRHHTFVSVEPMLGPVDISDALCWEFGRPINLVICGGESGPSARWMEPIWARDLRYQCRDAGVPFYMKQMSGGSAIPDDLMVRETPFHDATSFC